MKQFITFFTAAVIGLLSVSCNMEDIYTVTNLDDLVTVAGEYLVSDLGTTYHITENKTGTQDWLKDGNRLYAIFDVRNRQLDVCVNEVYPMVITEPEPISVEDEETRDPVLLALHSVSGGYVNLALQIYKGKATECPHTIRFQYLPDLDEKTVKLYVLHDGNNENPSFIAEKDLDKETRFYSVPVAKFATSKTTQITLVMDVLVQDDDGKYSVSRSTYPLVQR